MLVMIPFQQDNLVHVVTLKVDDVHQVIKETLRRILLPLFRIWIKIIPQEYNLIYLLYIFQNRLFPKGFPMYVRDDEYLLRHILADGRGPHAMRIIVFTKKEGNMAQGTVKWFSNEKGYLRFATRNILAWV